MQLLAETAGALGAQARSYVCQAFAEAESVIGGVCADHHLSVR